LLIRILGLPAVDGLNFVSYAFRSVVLFSSPFRLAFDRLWALGSGGFFIWSWSPLYSNRSSKVSIYPFMFCMWLLKVEEEG
jgi:hypothetical protein